MVLIANTASSEFRFPLEVCQIIIGQLGIMQHSIDPIGRMAIPLIQLVLASRINEHP
jgi:hypothetical protein